MKKSIFIIFLAFSTLLSAQKPTQEWLDKKYSMFIHFGLYSVFGGIYNGQRIEQGYSEQIQSHAGIFSDWYALTAEDFNPVNWNPDSVVALAKAAGMRSIVFTAKHHDGFCMFHSQHTRFNIVDATPFGRDLMKELAEACARAGIGFGVYFSLIDWHFPQAYPISSHNADPITPEHHRFNMKQVEEIMTNYGPITEIWFDMGLLTLEQSQELYHLVQRLQPQTMISGRLGNDYADFAVMADNELPDYQLGVPWQTPASIFRETWGYRTWQERGCLQEKIDEKIGSLIQVISRGGNFLLNIGPRGDGSIVEFERDVLLGVGEWVKVNAEAIYGTRANPFDHPFSWGDVTTRGNDLFLFVRKEFEGTEIELQGIRGGTPTVTQLGTERSCSFNFRRDNLRIRVPEFADSRPYTVLRVSFDGGFSVLPSLIVRQGTPLTPQNSIPTFGHSSLDYYSGYKSLIAYNWAFATNRRQITPEIRFTDNEKGKEILVEVGGQTQQVTLNSPISTVHRVPEGSVTWGNLYMRPGRGVFGNVPEENQPPIVPDAPWELLADFEYGEEREMRLRRRGSMLFLQKIHSDREQTIAVEIGSGNGVYILLNGQYITAHFSPERKQYQTEIVLLPLQRGDNQLFIRYYNRFEPTLRYSITPLTEWTVYTQQLSPVRLDRQEYHRLSMRLANPVSRVAPIRLNNVRIGVR
jgi:alpha-L-fucosidase